MTTIPPLTTIPPHKLILAINIFRDTLERFERMQGMYFWNSFRYLPRNRNNLFSVGRIWIPKLKFSPKPVKLEDFVVTKAELSVCGERNSKSAADYLKPLKYPKSTTGCLPRSVSKKFRAGEIIWAKLDHVLRAA